MSDSWLMFILAQFHLQSAFCGYNNDDDSDDGDDDVDNNNNVVA